MQQTTIQRALRELPAPPCPTSLIEADGTPLFGVYAGTPETVELERLAGPWMLRFRQKRWQYIAVLDEKVIAAAAVADAGYIGLAFVVVWDRARRQWIEIEDKLPLRFGVLAIGNPGFGEHQWSGVRGAISMSTTREGRTLVAKMRGRGHEVELDLEIPSSGVQPITVVAPVGSGPNVTHKAAGLSARGIVRVDGRELRIDPARALAAVDWTRGFPPYRTRWNWSMAAGRTIDGQVVGFNLCSGFNDAIDTENALWLDGRPRRLGPVKYSTSDEGPWRIRGEGVDLIFRPEAERRANENYLLVASRYRQPVGTYSGVIAGVELDAIPGVAEDHFARW